MVTEGSESAKVCANLCAMEHAHPDREKWVQHAKEIKEIREINKKKEWINATISTIFMIKY